jgi:uncharacterized protein YkwD
MLFVRRAKTMLPFIALCALSLGCGPRTGSRGQGARAEAARVERPSGPMSLEDARNYVLALVNRDRAEEGLDPVEYDQTAERAAQRHVEDMTRQGYTGHWATDGSVPEQRYTEAGGKHLVQENAACFSDATLRELDPSPTFLAADLEEIQGRFMDEVPPADGHRRNILKKWHTGLGVGLAQPRGIRQPCLTHEFVDVYGQFETLPLTAKVGQVVRVAGELQDPVEFGAVGLAWTEAVSSIPVEELLQTSMYPMPDPFILYHGAGYKTPKPVQVDGKRFSIDIPLDHKKRPGRYSVSVWGHFPDAPASQLTMVSLRTILVR